MVNEKSLLCPLSSGAEIPKVQPFDRFVYESLVLAGCILETIDRDIKYVRRFRACTQVFIRSKAICFLLSKAKTEQQLLVTTSRY